MAYSDPYDPYTGRNQAQQYNADSTPDFSNPYSHPHQTYDQGAVGYEGYNASGGYRDEPHQGHEFQPDYNAGPGGSTVYPPPQRAPSQRTDLLREKSGKHVRMSVSTVTPIRKEGSGFEHGEFTPVVPRKRTPSALRAYRYDHQGNLWARGSKAGCFGRFCCCTLMIAILLIVCTLLSLVLWVRPPGIVIGTPQLVSQGGSTVQIQNGGLTINFGLNISVANPNYFSVNFNKINADLIYPINNTDIGGGSLSNVVFESHSQKNITFPFAIDYKTSSDPSNAILLDFAQKCGVIGGTKTDLTVTYKITLALRIVFFTVSPVISNSFSFPCPIDASSLEGMLGGITGTTTSG